jgi:hypothetical protein
MDVWSETLIQAMLEQKTASEICEYVLRHYVSLPAEERRPISAILEQQLQVYLGM